MVTNMMPFNIELLILKAEDIKIIKQVKSLDIFENNTQQFKSDGLFSNEIFGEVGSKERNNVFGYIDLKIKVFHPEVYRYITSFKSLYGNIMMGKDYAIFDNKIKDFVLSNQEYGDTGFEFFIKHFSKVDLKDNGSEARAAKIELIKRYKLEDLLLDKYLVIPAGLRDYTIDKSGRASEDEVNTLYRKLIKTTNLISGTVDTEELILINATRARLQQILVEIYEHYESLLKGKSKFLQDKWSKRAITNKTRNIATITPIETVDLRSGFYPSFNDTIVGLYQYVNSIIHIFSFHLRDRFLNKIFTTTSNAILVNAKTNKTEYVSLDGNVIDNWMSDEGINSMVHKLSQEELRSEPVYVTPDYYLMLIYDDGKNIYLIGDTNNIPDEFNNPKYIRPITYMELLYLSIWDISKKYPAFVERYPVANLGSTYPCKVYLKVTVKARTITLKSSINPDKTIHEYPIIGAPYFNSMAVHGTHITRMALDYDGDQIGLTVLFTKDSVDEINNMLSSKEYYITNDGEITYSASNAVIDNLMNTINKFN